MPSTSEPPSPAPHSPARPSPARGSAAPGPAPGLFGPGRPVALDLLAALCLAGALPTVLMSLDPGAGLAVRGIGLLLGLAFLGLPFLVLDLLTRGLRSPALRFVSGAAMAAALAVWWWAWHGAYRVPANSDPQNALIFAILPVYGAGLAAMLGMALKLLDRWMAR